MRKNRSSIFVIILVLTASISNFDNSQQGYNKPNLESLESSIHRGLDMVKRIRENSEKVDLNNDKIADYLENRQGIIDAIILFEKHSYIPNSLNLKGFEILQRYSSIPAIHASIDSRIIDVIASLPGIAVIEENLPLKPKLAYSTSQLGVRPYLWDKGIQGNGDYSIAIVDSGIDFTHKAFDGRILTSYNAFDNNATIAIDNDGHGTHVAGIAAGLPVTGSIYSQTARGILPPAGNLFVNILFANVNKSTSITAGMDWGEPGADFPGGEYYITLLKKTGSTLTFVSEVSNDSGIIETTFPSLQPGDYYIGFGTNIDSGQNLLYEGWADLTLDSELPQSELFDGYEAYSGVAPKANLVVVKAIDPVTGGTSTTFIDAIEWIINNKDVYNITVTNLSIGIDVIQSTLDSQIANLTSQGIIAVVAAGNSGKESGGIFSPASAEEAITVGALNRFNEIAAYSSNGQPLDSEVKSIKPDIVAPGGSPAFPFSPGHETSYLEGLGLIVAPDSNNIGINVKKDDLIGLQGTSMASPHIAGLALLLMEKYAETNGWDRNSSDDVFKIKRAILAGSFEVANIGSSGGEAIVTLNTNFPKQTPSLNRNSKDFVEGWGAVNARAALGALNEIMVSNFDIPLEFGLEDPFTSNVYSWKTTLSPNTIYAFSANVPAGADIDLLVFESDVGNFGDLVVLESTSSGPSINETLIFSVTQQKEVILTVRLVDSANIIDLATVKFEDPNFQPKVEITFPKDGSYLNIESLIVEFTSTSNTVNAFIDDDDIGFINSGYALNPLSEGVHNLTLIEENTNTEIRDTDQSMFTIDVTLPSINSNSNITTLTGLLIEDPIYVNYTVNDELLLDRIEIRVGDTIGSSLQLVGNASSGVIELDPWKLPSGLQNVEIRVYDKAGNFNSIITTINIVHKAFVTPQNDIVFESENETPLVITWNSGTNSSSHYIITINGELMQNVTWDGSPVVYTLPTLAIGEHIITIQVFDINGDNATDTVIIIVVDSIAPRINGPVSGEYDATFELILIFEVEELNPKSISFYIDNQLVSDNSWDGNQAQAIFTLEGNPGSQTEVTIEVFDTEDNLGSLSVQIQWIDDTPAVIIIPTLREFIEGNAPFDLEWQWNEKFVTQVKLQINKETIDSLLGNTINSILYSQVKLNKLKSGTYEFRIIVSDSSGNNFASTIEIKVRKGSSGGSFIPSFKFTLVLSTMILFTITIRKKYRNYNPQ